MDFIRKQLRRAWNACWSGRGQIRIQSRLFSSPGRGKFPPLWMASSRAFPSLLKTDDRPHRLLAVGGPLTEDSLQAAYATGIYPVYVNEQLNWIVFNPRMVLFLEKTKLQNSMRRLIRSGRFRVTLDTAFEEVVRECGCRKWTWLVPERVRVAVSMHKRGQAHSVEVWNQDGKLVGGAFGTDMGRLFIGESVFHSESNAGKVAYACLFCHLQHWGYEMVDAQAYNKHVETMGFEEISCNDYINRLKKLVDTDIRHDRWALDEELDVAGWIPASPGSQVKGPPADQPMET